MVLSYSIGPGTSHSVSFTPAYVRVPQFEFAPFQRINLAVSGKLHVFQYSTNENLIIPTIWHDLPYFDQLDDPRLAVTQGLQSLLSFIRYTLNYYANSATLLCPDGQTISVNYFGGAQDFLEASDGQNMSPRAQRWSGTLNWLKTQP